MIIGQKLVFVLNSHTDFFLLPIKYCMPGLGLECDSSSIFEDSDSYSDSVDFFCWNSDSLKKTAFTE